RVEHRLRRHPGRPGHLRLLARVGHRRDRHSRPTHKSLWGGNPPPPPPPPPRRAPAPPTPPPPPPPPHAPPPPPPPPPPAPRAAAAGARGRPAAARAAAVSRRATAAGTVRRRSIRWLRRAAKASSTMTPTAASPAIVSANLLCARICPKLSGGAELATGGGVAM